MSNENQVLVTALVDIEHDREKHIPGTKSANFLIAESSVDALVKAGAVKLAAVVDADALTVASAGATAIASATSVTFADVADHLDELAALRSQLAQVTAERNELLANLGEAQAMRDGLADEVEGLKAQLAALASAGSAASQGGTEAGGDADAAGAADGASGADAAEPAAEGGSAEASSEPAAAARTTRARK